MADQRKKAGNNQDDQTRAAKEELRVPDPAALVKAAKESNQGDRPWRLWKDQAIDELRELAEKSPLMDLLQLDARDDLRAVYRIQQPVPRWPQGEELIIGDEAIYYLGYREEWRWQSPPGWHPVGLFKPNDIFHPNCRPSLTGAICLGDLPPGIPPKELVLLAYFTTTLQDASMSEVDPHGVMNAQASEFFRSHSHYMPLTRAGLFDQPAEKQTDTA